MIWEAMDPSSRRFPCASTKPGLKRDFRITADLLEKFGYTADCAGCEAKILGTDHRNHSAECRARLEKKMRQDEKMTETFKRRDKGVQVDPAPETIEGAHDSKDPDQHNHHDEDVQMEVSEEEEMQIFLDEDGFEYTGKTSEVNGPEAACPRRESCLDVEVPDVPAPAAEA